MKIIVTGVAGFLGRHFVKYVEEHSLPIKIWGLDINEEGINKLKEQYIGHTFFHKDITDKDFSEFLENLIVCHQIDYIIHAAANKYVDECEDNPLETIDVNINASINIIKSSLKHNIKNLIHISTDKAQFPIGVYGATKLIIDRYTLASGYSVFTGVNFLGSDGSVIDKWRKASEQGLPLRVANYDCIRYYLPINEIVESIIDHLDYRGHFYPKQVYEISLYNLLGAFQQLVSYDKVEYFALPYFEKQKECLDEEIEVKVIDNKNEIISFLKQIF